MAFTSEVDPPDFGLTRGAEPVRVIRPRTGRRSMPGWFPTTKGTLEALRTETTLELDGLGHFEVNFECQLMAAQPHVLRYRGPTACGRGTVDREYTPDLAIRMLSGRVAVIDFKVARYARLPEWRAREALLRRVYEVDHGATFRTVTDEAIYVEPRHSNVAVMLMHRRAVPDPQADVAVRTAVATLGLPATIPAVRALAGLTPRHEHEDRAFGALVAMVMSGEARFDLGVPLLDPTAQVLAATTARRDR